MKPIACVPCRTFFRPKHTGIKWVEGRPKGNRVPPGMAEPENWLPYKLWTGDLWACRSCGAEVIIGMGALPISEDHRPDFRDKIIIHGAQIQINDC